MKLILPPDTILQAGIGPSTWAITQTGLRTPTGIEIHAGEMTYNLLTLAAPPVLLTVAYSFHRLTDPCHGGQDR